MSRPTTAAADSYIYTASPFGHDGINGFQFVGMPAGDVAGELIDFLAAHIGFTAPLGVPSHPSSAEIEEAFPKITRIFGRGPDGRSIVIRSSYIGQVYQSGGARGKWGNFFGHALVFDSSAPLGQLLALASTAPWRKGLTPEELVTGKALYLPKFTIDVPPPTVPASQLGRENLEAALAAVLCRLDGDVPLLLEDTTPEQALAIFLEIDAVLEDRVRAKLSWSSFEFDGGADYDIVATCGDTKLTQSANAFQGLRRLPTNELFIWGGRTACNEGVAFWNRLWLLCNPDTERGLKDGLDLLFRVDCMTADDLSAVSEAMAMICNARPDDTRVQAAAAVFSSGFDVLGSNAKDDFALLAQALNEADRLRSWAGTDLVHSKLHDWVNAFYSVRQVVDSGHPEPLEKALENAVEKGCSFGEVLKAATFSFENYVDENRHIQTLSIALHAFVTSHPEEAENRWDQAAELLTSSPALETVLKNILHTESMRASVRWLSEITTRLGKAHPEIADRSLRPIQIDQIRDREHLTPLEADQIAEALSDIGTDSWLEHATAEDAGPVLDRIEQALPQLSRSRTKQVSNRLLNFAVSIFGSAEKYPNALAYQATECPVQLKEILESRVLFRAIVNGAHCDSYHPFIIRVWAVRAHDTISQAESDYITLWRPDIRKQLADIVVKHFLSSPKRRGLLRHVSDALDASSNANEHSKAQSDWEFVAQTIAIKLAMKISDNDFALLLKLYPDDPRVEEIAEHRSRTFGAIVKSAFRGIRGWVGRKGERS